MSRLAGYLLFQEDCVLNFERMDILTGIDVLFAFKVPRSERGHLLSCSLFATIRLGQFLNMSSKHFVESDPVQSHLYNKSINNNPFC